LHGRPLVLVVEERAVRGDPRAAPGAAHALQEAGDGRGGVDLQDVVEVADVDAELEGAGGDDHAVTPSAKARSASRRALAASEP
jgi:hypothetical protein